MLNSKELNALYNFFASNRPKPADFLRVLDSKSLMKDLSFLREKSPLRPFVSELIRTKKMRTLSLQELELSIVLCGSISVQ